MVITPILITSRLLVVAGITVIVDGIRTRTANWYSAEFPAVEPFASMT